MKRNYRTRNRLALEHLDWARSIARHVASMLPTWFTAEDLTGPAELALVRQAELYDRSRGVPFRAFAGRRIYGACFDSVRRREYRERGHESLDGVHQSDESPSPEKQAAASEQVKVWRIVQSLPARHQLVILSVYGGDMTLESLAELVDVGPSRLSQIHREALGMLRQEMTA